MNYRLTFYILAEIILILGAILLIPFFMAVGFGETSSMFGFGVTIACCIVLGGAGLFLRPKKDQRSMRPSCGMMICGFAWIIIGLIGAMPYVLSNSIPSYIDAVFETVSGITTTGSSILNDIEILPKSILFWRSLSQWIGGMGVLVFVIAIIPKKDGSATALAKAEIPGPQFGKLVSKMRFSARILYAMYVVMTLIEVAILCGLKMPVFDSFCHAMTTASTGGFSVKNASIAAYNSVGIEVTITVFMLLFSVNFNVYFMYIAGQFLKALKNEETLWMFSIYGVVVAGITTCLVVSSTYATVGESLRHASFTVASIISTTGYVTANYETWPVFAHILLLAIMFIGGSAGSTAGGLKVSRVIILGKSSMLSAKKMLSPRSVSSVRLDGKPVGDDIIHNTSRYFVWYMFIFVVSTLFVALDKTVLGNGGIVTSISSVATCLNNVGPGLAGVGPVSNFADLTIFSKIVLCFDMLIGRLEILHILLIFYPKAWRSI
ncbi:MAG: TrkH family potassium uptake protein [Clostridia bacterium]|nr:TrkH family potassium uptake protein [Clostridia bacterium]